MNKKREEWAARQGYAKGRRCMIHGFTNKYTAVNTKEHGLTLLHAVICEFEDGHLEAANLHEVTFTDNFYESNFSIMRYLEKSRRASEVTE